MNLVKIALLATALGLTGCATTNDSKLAEAVDAYPNQLDANYLASFSRNIAEECTERRYGTYSADTNFKCEVVGSLFVVTHTLKNRRWEWFPEAGASVTSEVMDYVCSQSYTRAFLEQGGGVVVDLRGQNGFVGNVKTLKIAQAKPTSH
ncbi:MULTISPECIES: hypothetical protein [Aliagarivorans]|uniref:hypothetical protein n=1 Tax=Aliagarivorans TaxID=882379 RepID=UPI00041972A8|nr:MULTISPECIES: hypothetical protein [Aliagarivorans]